MYFLINSCSCKKFWIFVKKAKNLVDYTSSRCWSIFQWKSKFITVPGKGCPVLPFFINDRNTYITFFFLISEVINCNFISFFTTPLKF